MQINVGTNDQLMIRIRDDGKGFDPVNIRHSGNGVKNMQQRIKIIHGTFTIDKKNIAKFQSADAGGYKNFTVDLNKLKDPSSLMELNNMKEFQKLNQQKIQNLYQKK